MSAGAQWILVRHGDTEWTEKNLLHGGRLDSPLSARGRNQAQRTAQALGEERVSAFYASPQGRAQETAAIIGEAIGLTATSVEEFREYKFGWLEGRPMPDFGENGGKSKILKPIANLIMTITGERSASFQKRVAVGLQRIAATHKSDPVIIVTHWGVLTILTALLLEENLEHWEDKVKWAPCGITRLQVRDNKWEMIQYNAIDHLNGIGK